MDKDIMIKIPKDWERKNLNEVGYFSKGSGISGEQLKKIGIPCVCYGDLYTKYDIKFCIPKNFTDKNAIEESVAINKGTLLFTATGETAEEIGKCVCYYGEETIYVGGDIIILQTKDINPLFIAYQQNLFPFIKQKARLGQGHSVVHIRLEDIKKISIICPKNLQEQEEIVKILMSWDNAIELQKQLIEKLELQKKGLMQKLLEPREDWITNKIKNIFTITRGQILAMDNCNDSYLYPVYSSQTQNDGLMGYYKSYLYENAITWTTDGANAGEVKYRNGKFYCTNVCGILLNMDGYANECFAYLLNSIAKRYVSFVGNPKLMNNVMAEIKISYPPLEKQKKISIIYSELSKQISLHSQKLTLLKRQRKSLMQLLLTGTKRVKI